MNIKPYPGNPKDCRMCKTTDFKAGKYATFPANAANGRTSGRTLAGFYQFTFTAMMKNGPQLAPVGQDVEVLPGDPSSLMFTDCPTGRVKTPIRGIAGVAIEKTIQILDAYNNPTTGWTNDIKLSAKHLKQLPNPDDMTYKFKKGDEDGRLTFNAAAFA